MKKLKQMWAIIVMVKTFLPRVFKEFKDLTTLFTEIKHEWFRRFPPEMKARAQGHTTLFIEEIKRGYNPPPKDEDLDPVYTPPPPPVGPPNVEFSEDGKVEREVPDGRSYFKKKPGKAK
jgi:hypothetical protein